MIPEESIWRLAPSPDPALVASLSQRFSLAPAVVALAVQRGHDDEERLARFLQPRLKDLADPFGLPGMEAAVARLLEAADRRERVLLFGDYDVDGVTSVALLDSVLRAYGLETHCYLPARLEEGYGLSLQGVENGLAEFPADLLVAADCGTNSREAAALLAERGVELVILDHHEPSPEGVAACAALVNPKLGDRHHYLCTAGVVFKLAHALLKTRPVPGYDLKEELDLVALGTIADIVPLEDENRLFARRGLAQLERTRRPGLVALKAIAGVGTPVRASDVGFRLGPRLNAAGRLDTALEALRLLQCEDAGEATALAEDLDLRNRERQTLESATREEAEAQIAALSPEERAHGIVVAARGWHAGVVGIVASRVSRRYHRPAFVIAIDENGLGKGSGRSVPGISLVRALEDARSLIETGGGHDLAAGVGLREERLVEFRAAFSRSVREQAGPDTLLPKLHLDAEVALEELTLELLESYELLRPFGAANPQPVFLSRAVRPRGEVRVIKDRHLKFRFEQRGAEREAIYFQAAGQDLPRPPWDIAFTVDRNEYRGRVSLNLVLVALRAAERGFTECATPPA